MRRNLSIKKLGILCLAGFLMVAPQIFAEQDDFGLNDSGEKSDTKGLFEKDIIDNICKRMSKEGEDPKYGFQSLKEVTLKGKTKKVFVPLWYNDKLAKPEDNPDPFRLAIKKDVMPIPERRPVNVKPVDKTPAKPVTPPPPPIKIFVKGIVGNEGSRLAIVEFEKEEMTITKDQIVEGKFKVVDIYADRVVVYSNKEQRRHTFKIGGEEKEK